ncbi:hypothetical protein TYRP_023693 [Tyrophagus putrescentiae]|nr:hypothetical protein TYRP_023693 [Tyrophagus putrescentiae]
MYGGTADREESYTAAGLGRHLIIGDVGLRGVTIHIGQRGGELNQAVIQLAEGDRAVAQLKANLVDDLAADGVRHVRGGPLNVRRVDDHLRAVCCRSTSRTREECFRWSVHRLDDRKGLLLLLLLLWFRAKSELQRLPLLPAAILLRFSSKQNVPMKLPRIAAKIAKKYQESTGKAETLKP